MLVYFSTDNEAVTLAIDVQTVITVLSQFGGLASMIIGIVKIVLYKINEQKLVAKFIRACYFKEENHDITPIKF